MLLRLVHGVHHACMAHLFLPKNEHPKLEEQAPRGERHTKGKAVPKGWVRILTREQNDVGQPGEIKSCVY